MKHPIPAIALVLATSASAGCLVGAWGGSAKTLPVVEQFPDGTRKVALAELKLQVRAPDSIRLFQSQSGMTEVIWGEGWADYVRIDTSSAEMHDSADGKITELQTALRSFTLGELAELADGYDFYYSYYDSSLEKKLGYYSQRTIAGNRYRCFLSSPSYLNAVKLAKQLCRSMEPLQDIAPATK